jgi:hypothetical protein
MNPYLQPPIPCQPFDHSDRRAFVWKVFKKSAQITRKKSLYFLLLLPTQGICLFGIILNNRRVIIFLLSSIRVIRIIRVIRVKNFPLTMIHSPFTIFFPLSFVDFVSFLFKKNYPRSPRPINHPPLTMIHSPLSNLKSKIENSPSCSLFEPRFEYLFLREGNIRTALRIKFYERKPFEPPFPSRTPRGKGKSALLTVGTRGYPQELSGWGFTFYSSFIFPSLPLCPWCLNCFSSTILH